MAVVTVEMDRDAVGEAMFVSHSPAEVADIVSDFTVVILKRLFDPELLAEARKVAYEWGQSVAEDPRDIADVGNGSWHELVRGKPKPGTAPRLWHGYVPDLARDEAEFDDFARVSAPIFRKLAETHRLMTGLEFDFHPSAGTPAIFRPQFIQYPRGGGYLWPEWHPRDPIRINQVVALSERGTDFEDSSTVFLDPDTGTMFGTDDVHDIGDVCLFSPDLLHGVSPVDEWLAEDAYGFGGRWTALLPALKVDAISA